jgi:hypothetical protein
MTNNVLDPSEIIRLAQASGKIETPCGCSRRKFDGWDAMPATFPEELLTCVGMISPAADEEPTLREFHPDGSNYWSPDAPIAVHYFPANRCGVWQCAACGRCFLRYTEFGGYYVEKRMRALRPDLIAFDSAPS